MTGKSSYLSLCNVTVILRYAREHVSVEIANPLNDFHMSKEEFESWEKLGYTIGFILFDNLLQMPKSYKMDWKNLNPS